MVIASRMLLYVALTRAGTNMGAAQSFDIDQVSVGSTPEVLL
jgi:hypothetical protein